MMPRSSQVPRTPNTTIGNYISSNQTFHSFDVETLDPQQLDQNVGDIVYDLQQTYFEIPVNQPDNMLDPGANMEASDASNHCYQSNLGQSFDYSPSINSGSVHLVQQLPIGFMDPEGINQEQAQLQGWRGMEQAYYQAPRAIQTYPAVDESGSTFYRAA